MGRCQSSAGIDLMNLAFPSLWDELTVARAAVEGLG